MIHQLRRLPDGLKQAILYGTSIALMKGVSLLMLPFIAYHLSPEEFGRLEVISTFAIIGSILVGMGMENTLFRFAGMSRNAKDRQRLAAEIFTLTLIIGSTAWLIGWFAAELIASWIPGNPSPYELRLVISMLALEGCISIPLGWLRMRNQVTRFFSCHSWACAGPGTTCCYFIKSRQRCGRCIGSWPDSRRRASSDTRLSAYS